MRDEQAGGAAVLGLEVVAVEAVDDPRAAARDVLDREVGRVAAVGERGDVAAERLDATPARGLELAVLVAASLTATITRYVALRTWVFTRRGRKVRERVASTAA